MDPLSPDEITKTRDILAQSISPERFSKLKFNIINLNEPLKSDLLPYFLANSDPPRNAVARKAFAILVEEGTGVLYEAVVHLDLGK